jgi:hypothetical protein
MVRSQHEQIVLRDPILKTLHKTGLMEWLKVKALGSSPSTAKKKKKKERKKKKFLEYIKKLLKFSSGKTKF